MFGSNITVVFSFIGSVVSSSLLLFLPNADARDFTDCPSFDTGACSELLVIPRVLVEFLPSFALLEMVCLLPIFPCPSCRRCSCLVRFDRWCC